MKGGAGRVWHAGLIVLCVWACMNDRSCGFLLESLLPAQRAVFAALMPDFAIRSFEVQARGAHLTLRAVTETRRYLAADGRAHPPGLNFDVETPARAALLYAVLVVAGALLLAPVVGRASVIAPLLSLPAAACMAIVPLPLILAGEHWGLAVSAGGEPSLPAALVAASGFLLHGGAYALCAATVWALAAITRKSRFRFAGLQPRRPAPPSSTSPASIIPSAAGSGTAVMMKSKP